LIVELAGGRASAEAVDVYPRPFERPRVTLRPERTDHVMGAPLDRETQVSYLAQLGLEVTEKDGVIEVTVPGYRPDIKREEDLIEEVARLAGFERLPSTLPSGVAGMLEPAQAFERDLRRTLAAAGLNEAWTSSFMSPQDLERLGLPEDHPASRLVALENPMGEDESVLRSTLLPGLLRSVATNVARGNRSVALFEVARIDEKSDEELPHEGLVLAAILTGVRWPQSWAREERKWGFFDAKGVVDSTFRSLGFSAPVYESV
jgi:phenylalanyl-tRNA synthetase beta chain